MKTAILIDGGFYRKRALYLDGPKEPSKRAEELHAYCMAHIKDKRDGEDRQLYRIFYYDCMPIKKFVYNPLTKQNNDLGKSETYTWTVDFLNELKRKRKFAIRLGELSDTFAGYSLNQEATKSLLAGKMQVSDIAEKDLHFSPGQQKGVDMKIGIDIASLCYKKQVDQIILIAGDSDFVPAAKLARREGVDFVLDPMGADIKDSLFEHIDGLRSPQNWKHQNQSPVKSKRGII